VFPWVCQPVYFAQYKNFVSHTKLRQPVDVNLPQISPIITAGWPVFFVPLPLVGVFHQQLPYYRMAADFAD